ncbi:MAG: sugar ABC transporter ATP-binding protein [Verrucomicrobia bacterium]|nr:sugar ABC transporter ATP-binding protein [Verrucomicrobiota bacterium]
MDSLLSVSNICKTYAVQVLSNVDFSLRRGEVHALVGENGAGKSTLVKIISGLIRQSAGSMELNGRPFAPGSRMDAEQCGIRTVLQELNLIGNLTVAENLFFTGIPNRFGLIRYHELNKAAAVLLDRFGLTGVNPRMKVSALGIGRQQLLEIAAAMSCESPILIMDEPTAALMDPEVELLFKHIKEKRDNGSSVIYISHRIEEIKRIADRITILRDGCIVGTYNAADIGNDEIINQMVGRSMDQVVERRSQASARIALKAKGLTRRPFFHDVSFELRKGEILGFAGLMGSGRTETMRGIFGADRFESGEIYLDDSQQPVSIKSPRHAVRNGIALLTEDRKEQGLFLPLSLRENITITNIGAVASRIGWINHEHEHAEADDWIGKLDLRCRSPEQKAVELSGGNQQKLVIAKWMFRDCRILIFDEPTRGIDVGAKVEIYKLLNNLSERGKAIIMVSSELNELMALCDRIAVMSAGKLAGVFDRGSWSQEILMEAAFSEYLTGERRNPQSPLDEGKDETGPVNHETSNLS